MMNQLNLRNRHKPRLPQAGEPIPRQRGATALEMAFLMFLIVVPLVYAVDGVTNRGGSRLDEDGERIGQPVEGYGLPSPSTTVVVASSSTSAPPSGLVVASAGFTSQATLQDNNKWTANLVITLTDSSGVPIAGATVSGQWSTFTGAKQDTSCITDGDGRCTVTQWGLKASGTDIVTDTTYTLLDATGDGVSIDPAVVGTSVTVNNTA